MVAIEITDDGVEVDALAGVDVHPAAELFPLLQGEEFAALVADIAAHGQRDPIVTTPDGQLLDGRNRWRACAKAGIKPVTRVEVSEPWAFVISTNLHRRHLNDSQRAMVAAQIAEGPRGGARGAMIKNKPSYPGLPPTQSEAAQLLNITTSAITRAREVVKKAAPPLLHAAEAGQVPVYTAARVAREMTPAQQAEFVRRVANGANPTKLAAALDVPSDWVPQKSEARTDNRRPDRHRHINVAALHSLSDSLAALDLVLRSTDGLDPSLTPDEAAHWWGDLAKGRGAIRRVMNLLTERKESTQ